MAPRSWRDLAPLWGHLGRLQRISGAGFLVENRLKLAPELRNRLLRYFPDDGEVDIRVVVDQHIPHRGSKWDRVLQHGIANSPTDGGFGHHMNLPPEEFLEVLFDSNDVQEMAARFEVDQKIEIAICTSRPSGKRAKEPDPRCPMHLGDPQNLASHVVNRDRSTHAFASSPQRKSGHFE
jgi:hypothetical protein